MLGQPNCVTSLHSARLSLACTGARQEMRLLCECLMWIFVIPLIRTSTLVSLELAIIREVYTLFINRWDLLKRQMFNIFGKKASIMQNI